MIEITKTLTKGMMKMTINQLNNTYEGTNVEAVKWLMNITYGSKYFWDQFEDDDRNAVEHFDKHTMLKANMSISELLSYVVRAMDEGVGSDGHYEWAFWCALSLNRIHCMLETHGIQSQITNEATLVFG